MFRISVIETMPEVKKNIQNAEKYTNSGENKSNKEVDTFMYPKFHPWYWMFLLKSKDPYSSWKELEEREYLCQAAISCGCTWKVVEFDGIQLYAACDSAEVAGESGCTASQNCFTGY